MSVLLDGLGRCAVPVRSRPVALGMAAVCTVSLCVVLPAGAPAGAAVSPARTELASADQAGNPVSQNDGPGDIAEPALSADGRFLAFTTRVALDPLDAANDSANPGAAELDVYLRDRQNPGRTILLSRGIVVPEDPGSAAVGSGPAGPALPVATPLAQPSAEPPAEAPANGSSAEPSISATGRFVAFATEATNLNDGAGGTSDRHVVICDRDPDGDGIFDEPRPDGAPDYTYITVTTRDQDSRLTASVPDLSADGTTVTWNEAISNSVSPPRTVVARLGRDGAGRLQPPQFNAYHRPQPVDTGDNETQGTYYRPRVSANGRYVVFTAYVCPTFCETFLSAPSAPAAPAAANDIGNTVQQEDVDTGQVTRLDLDPATGAPLPGDAVAPVVSEDGAAVAFVLTNVDTGQETVTVSRRGAEGNRSLSTASRDTAGTLAEGEQPALSADGRYLAFSTRAPGMHNGRDRPDPVENVRDPQVVVRDLLIDGQREAAGLPRLPAELASVSAGRDCAPDVSATDSCTGNGPSTLPVLTADGSAVVFTSAADDLLNAETPCCAGNAFARAFQPTVAVDPVDFGAVPLGSTATATVTVRHSGFGPLRPGPFTVRDAPEGEFSFTSAENCANTVLYETTSCVLQLRFTPKAEGTRTAVLDIGVPGAAPVAVPVRAVGGTPAPSAGGLLTAAPDPLVFPGERLALAASEPLPVTVTNSGTAPFTVTGVSLLAGPRLDPADFWITGTDCAGANLAPGARCTVTVISTPVGSGTRLGALRVDSTAPGAPQLVTLSAQATVPVLEVSPGIGRSGRVVQVTGRGFPAAHPVLVVLDAPASAPVVTVTTAPDGSLAAPLLLFANAVAGGWPVTGTSPGTTLRVQVPLLVAGGSYQPPGFTSRR